MTKPTPAQIEAAAKAMCLARKPNHPSLEDESYWKNHGSRQLYLDMARAALTAAAEVGEPTPDRAMKDNP